VNIIPTSTGAARTTGLVIPELAGRLDGLAIRVPVEDSSLTDLTVLLARSVTADEVNEAFREAAEAGPLSTVLRYTADPIVSRDVIGESASCTFDSGFTAADGELVKVFGWYDNEYGYTSRLADLCEHVAAQL
jgi:glyceraldehyde 3-phosphate dehydrogenase